MKYAVEMVRKNFEIDIQGLFLPVVPCKKKKHPKKAAMSGEKIFIIIVLSIVGLAVHVTCLFVFSQHFQDKFIQFEKMSGDV